MTKSRLHYCPIALVVTFPFAFFLSYVIAISTDHIVPIFSYISDAGTLPPEMNIFAQLLNIGCLFYLAVVYIRFKQVELYYKLVYKDERCVANIISLIIGICAVLGISIVANFQEKFALPVHLFGAFLSFVGGGIWLCFQGFFSFKLLPHFGTKCLAYQRLVLAVIGVIMYVTCQSTAIISLSQFKGTDKLKWNSDDGGWIYRGISVVLEWLMVLFFELYILTFVGEFRKISLDGPNFTFMEMNFDTEPALGQIGGGDLNNARALTCVHTQMKEQIINESSIKEFATTTSTPTRAVVIA